MLRNIHAGVKDKSIALVLMTQNFINHEERYSVSLKDVSRFIKIYEWLLLEIFEKRTENIKL